MRDGFGREISYMRISITDRCNLRCRYCRTQEEHGTKKRELSPEEIGMVCESVLPLGIRHFRITGGEPFVRSDCMDILRRIRTISREGNLGITTNGIYLEPYLEELKELGLNSLNISLDTMNRKVYQELTGGDFFGVVIRNIEKACEMGIPVKVNCVPRADLPWEEWMEFLKLIQFRKLSLRFIEYMPMGETKTFQGKTKEEILQLCEKAGLSMKKEECKLGMGPAEYYCIDGYEGNIGFIQPIHGKFCHQCNRIRFTSDGRLQLCLAYRDGLDVTPFLKTGDKQGLQKKIAEKIKDKPAEHHFEQGKHGWTDMNRIGG